MQSDGCVGSLRVEEHLLNALDLAGGRVDVDHWLERYNLAHRKHDLIAHLSGGQRRKVAMLAGMLPGFVGQAPRILLLDEPAAGLDAASRTLLVEDLHELRNRGNAILLASHHTDFTACATHLLTGNTMETNEAFEESNGVKDDRNASSHRNNPAFRTGFLLNQRTLSTVASNGIAGFLTLGILLALFDASAVDSSLMQASGLFLLSLIHI